MKATSAQASCDAIDALLPQTQCRKCGYAGCRPYAEALSAGRAEINQCPPGGEDLIRDLAALLGVPFRAPDPHYGVAQPPATAVIDEQTCIGCTLCIQACPVDAIVGAARLMHTVITRECTGCALCLPPCPVDCISLHEIAGPRPRELGKALAAKARRRFEFRTRRLARGNRQPVRVRESTDRYAKSANNAAEEKKRATIEKAVARARSRLQQNGSY